MNEAEFKTRFPRASKSVMEANGIGGDAACADHTKLIQGSLSSAAPKFKPLRAAKVPNQTEREFGLMLREWFPSCTPEYEAMKLRVGSGCYYSPDWMLYGNDKLWFFEVKGSHIFDGSKEKFKAAKDRYPFAEFQMWQKKKGVWTRLL